MNLENIFKECALFSAVLGLSFFLSVGETTSLTSYSLGIEQAHGSKGKGAPTLPDQLAKDFKALIKEVDPLVGKKLSGLKSISVSTLKKGLSSDERIKLMDYLEIDKEEKTKLRGVPKNKAQKIIEKLVTKGSITLDIKQGAWAARRELMREKNGIVRLDRDTISQAAHQDFGADWIVAVRDVCQKKMTKKQWGKRSSELFKQASKICPLEAQMAVLSNEIKRIDGIIAGLTK